MYNIIPFPQNINTTDAVGFDCKKLIFAKKPLNDSALSSFCNFCKKNGVEVSFDEEKNNVDILFDENIKPEGYALEIENNYITIKSSADSGIFYAFETLKQLIFQTEGSFSAVRIFDEPKYAYRGFMLDVGRYFYSVDEVKGFIDRMALHKLNTLHFHLTEDQGWRVEIKKYPLLTEIGSHRSHTNFGFKKEGGFYTKEDIKNIVSYAHDRFIKVIPEFDIPGHSRAAIACYPYLSCFERELPVATHWGVKHDVLCVGKDSTYEFIFGVLDELCEMFPDRIIHIGGDEVPKMRWEICPECQRKKEENNLKGNEELQQYFMTVIADYLDKKGYQALMWNWDSVEPTKLLSKKLGWTLCGYDEKTKPTVESELINGRKMISTKAMEYYLDMPYGYVNLKKCCEYNPEEFFSSGSENFLGVEAALWTEMIPNVKKADFMTFPRLAAISNTAWHGFESGMYESLTAALSDYFKLLDFYSYYHAKKSSFDMTMPKAKFSGLWFERRQLYWEGLHNLIDDNKVKRKYGK